MSPRDTEKHVGAFEETGKETASGNAFVDGAKKLWQEAYEHPVASAAIVAGIAVTTYATRGQIGKILGSGGKSVLLVEDTPYAAQTMKTLLEKEGQSVTWLTGVKRANPYITGITESGQEMVVDPRRYKMAFVDGELKGSYLQGVHVVDALKKEGVPSIGISSQPTENAALRLNGAIAATEKPTAMTTLASHKFDLGLALRNPGLQQSRFDFVGSEMRRMHTKGAGPIAPEVQQGYDATSKLMMTFLSK
ncbi:MAG: response regulator [Candidatus Obscuribacter sp.]|nr:response regulator [Candidatus Obscuribacter sp.]